MRQPLAPKAHEFFLPVNISGLAPDWRKSMEFSLQAALAEEAAA